VFLFRKIAAMMILPPCLAGFHAISLPAFAAPKPVKKEGAATVVKGPKKAELSAAEKEIAKKLDYDEAVLLLIKERLNPEMSIVKMGGLEPSDDAQNGLNQQVGPTPPIPKDIDNYKKIAKSYPELAKVIDAELEHYKPRTMASFINHPVPANIDPVLKRYMKFSDAMGEIMPLLQQDARDKGIPQHAVGFLSMPGIGQKGFESDAELDEAIAKLKASVAGKSLRPENKAKSLLRLQYQSDGRYAYAKDDRMVQLQNALEKLGYRIGEESRGIQTRRQFETKAEAEAFLAASGTRPDGLALMEQKAVSYEAIYPIEESDRHSIESLRIIVVQGSPFYASGDKAQIEQMAQLQLKMADSPERTNPIFAAMMPDLRLEPGAVIKKIGDRRWHVDVPARFTATSTVKLATVTKVDKNSIGLELLENNHTYAPNYDISNEMVIEKVKYWNSKYGVQVTDAGRDRFTLKFKSLPDDMSQLCTEIFFFCPEIELSNDENENASRMRAMAKRIRIEKAVSFWWD